MEPTKNILAEDERAKEIKFGTLLPYFDITSLAIVLSLLCHGSPQVAVPALF